jgi:hypothetical protein
VLLAQSVRSHPNSLWLVNGLARARHAWELVSEVEDNSLSITGPLVPLS